jgi:hypothetical protein
MGWCETLGWFCHDHAVRGLAAPEIDGNALLLAVVLLTGILTVLRSGDV